MNAVAMVPPLPPREGRDVTQDAAAVTYRGRDPECWRCAQGTCAAPACAKCGLHMVHYASTARHVYGQCPGCKAWRQWEAAYAPRLQES